jgi:hypothetical protein
MYSVSFICPACQTPQNAQDVICGACGLVFASRPLFAADALASAGQCPHCAQPVRKGAQICGACGHALLGASAPFRLGQTLAHGRYTVRRPLSRGGMGALYLATDHAADRTVVITTLLDYFDPANPQQAQAARERLLREAATLAALRHPAIPHVFTSFQDGPLTYIVMEYIVGHDLGQGLTHIDDPQGRISSGRPYAQAEVLRWGIALCRVLEYLHRQQPHPIVHHDIKPGNLLIDRDSDLLFLVDFGTAGTCLPAPAGAGAAVGQPSLYGTVGYAPPEQYRGQSEVRSDVYALAATLYHLATDDNPWAHPLQFPQLDRLGALGQVLDAALQHDAARRPSADVLRQRLEALLDPACAPLIYTPNGAAVANSAALVGWCERHWAAAADWLYVRLPDQIEVWWGQADLAEELRAIVRAQSGDRNAGLDAALARLDPYGFGAAHPQLRAGKQTLGFGVLMTHTANAWPLTLVNDGRRYVRAQVQPPEWVRSDQPDLALIPARQTTLTLTARRSAGATAGPLHGTVRIYADTNDSPPLLQVEVWAEIGRERTTRARFLGVMFVLLLILCLVLVWWGNRIEIADWALS